MGLRAEARVLDVGGTRFFWDLASELGLPRIEDITILNIEKEERREPCSNIRWVVGDARSMTFADEEFDVVFSNSVIEHVGGLDSQLRFAAEVRRVGKYYWVQTPDPRFPVEPHYLTPFIHWIPKRHRSHFVRYGTVWGLIAKPTSQQVRERVKELRLIREVEFRSMFPDGDLVVERFCGLPKSLIAYRAPGRSRHQAEWVT